MMDFVNDNRSLVVQHGRDFQNIFGVSLSKYLHPIFGFDICKFDNDVVCSNDGESMREAVLRQ